MCVDGVVGQYGLMRPKDYGRVMRAAARITLPTSSLFVIDLDRRIRLIHHYNPAVGRWDRGGGAGACRRHPHHNCMAPHICCFLFCPCWRLAGRNLYEVLRSIDALQTAFFHQVSQPAMGGRQTGGVQAGLRRLHAWQSLERQIVSKRTRRNRDGLLACVPCCGGPCQVGTPCNWMQTEDVFVSPEVSTEAAAAMFPKGFMEIKPWFRLTPQPDVEEK